MAKVLFPCDRARSLSCAGRPGPGDGCIDIGSFLTRRAAVWASENKCVGESGFHVSED